VLLIEHDIGLVMDLSDRVMVMHQGHVLAEGSPAEVRADPAVQAAYFGHVHA
jgi:branched-chain amino acid transport system ATP-binding protein